MKVYMKDVRKNEHRVGQNQVITEQNHCKKTIVRHPCNQVFTNDDQMLFFFYLSYFITTVPWILHNGKYLQKYASHFSHGNLIFFSEQN